MPDTAKALVILSPAFAASETDSALPSQEILVRTFNRLYPSLKIVVLTFHYPVRQEQTYTWYGNKIITTGNDRKGKLYSLLRWQKVWQQLAQLHKTYELIGIFSFFCSECAFIGHYFAGRHNLIHKIWVLGQDARAGNPQVRRIKPQPEELVVISDFLQREFERNHHIRPAYVIPIGLDTTLFPPASGSKDIDLLAAGSLIPLKQYDQFVAVTQQVAARYPGLTSVLLGNGPEEASLKRQIAEAGIAQQIRMPGKQTHADTLAYMQHSRIFLHTSAYEGLGMVCLEALYAGAQVISFCKPLDVPIDHWHIVSNKEEMTAKALELLQGGLRGRPGTLPYAMEDTAIRLMQLFRYGER